MKALGPHLLTVSQNGKEFPLRLYFEIGERSILDAEAEIYLYPGSFYYECELFRGRKRVEHTGEVALMATLMRIAATHLRLDQEMFGVELYSSVPGDLSTDWSFYTFGEEPQPFVDPNAIQPPEA